MKNNNLAIYYMTDENDYGHYIKPDLPFEQWENYAKSQNYFKYEILDFRTYTAYQLHQTSNVVRFKGKYYIPEEKIPYPNFEAKYLGNFDVSINWGNEDEFCECDYDEVYKGISQLWTLISVDILISGKVLGKFAVYTQDFAVNLPKFLEKLKSERYAIYHNDELSYFKWLCWIKDDKIRLIQQDYYGKRVKTAFDILIDKSLFFEICEKMIKQMQQYTDLDRERYENYAIKKYGSVRKPKNQNNGNTEELGKWTKEMLKPENLIGPFKTTEEMMKSLLDDN